MINQIIHGDCFDVLKDIPDGSIDLILTDPPYGLKFMGKDWDHGVPGVQFWEQILRVAKPGAHLMAFGGTRTFHRLAVAIEDAGWEIRDTLMWVYGSGFPKSLDVSKAIDRAAGAEREVVGQRNPYFDGGKRANYTAASGNVYGGYKAIVMEDGTIPITAPATDAAKQWEGWGTALKPAWEPIILARKPLIGTIAENVLKYGTGAINVKGCRVENTKRVPNGISTEKSQYVYNGGWGKETGKESGHNPDIGRWPANLIHDGSDEVVELFPVNVRGAIPGTQKRGKKTQSDRNNNVSYATRFYQKISGYKEETGSAARFFYCAKASRKERGKGNTHPTVKPLKLIEYLITLGLPPGGTVLDPFCGSGTTALACKELGRNYICIEKELEYYQIACNRLNQPIEHIPDEPIEGPEEPVDNSPLQLALF